MKNKVAMLERHGYKFDEYMSIYIKEYTWNKKVVWKAFLSRSWVKLSNELELYKRIKFNDEHAKDYVYKHFC